MEKIIEKKTKGSRKKPRYGIRKLSVGVVACMLGYFVFMPTTIINATELKQNDFNSRIEAMDLGDKSSSGNTDAENSGYAPNGKYSFQDLKFNPEILDRENKANEVKFEIYGKHNIAASTDNWKINLQIDERIAKYITKIEVDPKTGTTSGRRVLSRKNDTLGRSTNIWQVNYIRSANGLFAGAETTDTQTAPNGIISFEKPLNEILAEISDEKLASDKLFYRIYLTSKQDNGGIVPGIDSTGFFFVNGIDHYPEESESLENKDWFKHSSVEARYIKNEKFNNKNGAIVVDHKISKNQNFAYNTSAKNTPWYLKYGVDSRLVKYIDGIELHMMSASSSTTPDYSVNNAKNRKVAELSIERREDNKDYGYGLITDNDLSKNLVNFNNALPTPVTIRYVYKLNKPMEEILADLKKEAGVEDGKAFGDDFQFFAWLTDKSQTSLIPNTYGAGFYRVQDIDGDGQTDDEEGNIDQSPYIGIPIIKPPYQGDKKVHASVLLNENAGNGNKAELINKNGETIATISDINAVDEEGKPATMTVELEFQIGDPSKLGDVGDDVTVRIIPSDERYPNGEEATVQVKEAPVAVKAPVEISKDADLTNDNAFAKKGIKNANSMPEGTKYSWKIKPDTSKIGEKTGVVLVQVPDRDEAFEITVPVKIIQSFEVTVTNPPKQTEGKKILDGTKVISANEENFTVSDVHDEGLNSGISIDKNGNLTGTPNKLQWGDEESTTYEEQTIKVHAIVTSEDGKTEKAVVVNVVVQRDTDGDGTPDIKDNDDDNDGVTDQEELDKGSDPKDPNSIPMIDITPIGKVDIENEGQTATDKTAIKDIVIKPSDKDATVVVDGSKLPNGVTYDDTDKTISGTVDVQDWGKDEEERDFTTTVTVTNKDGSKVEKEITITVQRDTDGDGTPDIKDNDDDNDGVTDQEELDKGSDPKDPNSIPMIDITPIGKVDIENEEQTATDKTAIKGPNTGYIGNGGLQVAGLLSSIGALLGVGFAKKRKKEEKHTK